MPTEVGHYKYFTLLTILLAVIQRRIHPNRIGAISHTPRLRTNRVLMELGRFRKDHKCW